MKEEVVLPKSMRSSSFVAKEKRAFSFKGLKPWKRTPYVRSTLIGHRKEVINMTDEDENPIVDDQSPSDDQPEDKPGKKSAEERINELLSKNKELEGKLSKIEEKMAPIPPAAPKDPTQELTPDVKKAVEVLKKIGFVTREEQDRKLQQLQDRAFLDAEHTKLENKYDGSDGKPKYDKKEVEKYMQEHGIFDSEAAYKLMFEKELLDFEMKRYEDNRKKKPFVQKPGSSAGSREDNTITREKISEWMKTPEGRLKYEQNRDKILKMMANNEL